MSTLVADEWRRGEERGMRKEKQAQSTSGGRLPSLRSRGEKYRPSLLLGGNHAIDGLPLLQLLLHLHHQLDTVHHQLDLLHLRGAQTICVGDVKHAADGGRVHAT